MSLRFNGIPLRPLRRLLELHLPPPSLVPKIAALRRSLGNVLVAQQRCRCCVEPKTGYKIASKMNIIDFIINNMKLVP